MLADRGLIKIGSKPCLNGLQRPLLLTFAAKINLGGFSNWTEVQIIFYNNDDDGGGGGGSGDGLIQLVSLKLDL